MVVLKFCSGNCEVLTLLIGNEQAIPHAARWVMRKMRKIMCCSETAYTVDNVLDLDRKSFSLNEKSTYQLLLDAHMYHYSLIRFYLDDGMEAIPRTYIFNEEDEDYALEMDHPVQKTDDDDDEESEDSKDSAPDLELREFLRFLENRQTLVMKAALKARDQQQRLLASCEAFGNHSQRNDLEAAFIPEMPAPDSQEEFFDPICCTSEATRVDHFVDALFDFSKKEEKETFTRKAVSDRISNASFSLSNTLFSDSLVNREPEKRAEANFTETLAEWEGMRKNVQANHTSWLDQRNMNKQTRKSSVYDQDVVNALNCFNTWPDHSKMIANHLHKRPDINVTMESSQAEGSLSMTVATSTDVEGKIDMVPAYTQTELQMLKEFEQLKISGQSCERTMPKLVETSSSSDSSTAGSEDLAECSILCLKTCLEKVEEALQDFAIKSVSNSGSTGTASERKTVKGTSQLILEAAKALDQESKRSRKEKDKEEKKERKERKEKERKEKKEKKDKKDRKDRKKRERKYVECKLNKYITMNELKECPNLALPVSYEDNAAESKYVEQYPCAVYEDYQKSKYHKYFPEKPICPKAGEMLVLHSLDVLSLEKMEELNLVRVNGQNYKRVKTRSHNNLRPVYRDIKMNSLVAPEPCLVFTEESDFINDGENLLKYFRIKNIGKVNIRWPQILIRFMDNMEIIDITPLAQLVEIENEYDIMAVVKPNDPRKEAVLIIQIVAETVLSLPTALIVPTLQAPKAEGSLLNGHCAMVKDRSWYTTKCLEGRKPTKSITLADDDAPDEDSLAERLRFYCDQRAVEEFNNYYSSLPYNEPYPVRGPRRDLKSFACITGDERTIFNEKISFAGVESHKKDEAKDSAPKPLSRAYLEDFPVSDNEYSDVDAIVSSLESETSESSDEYELVEDGDELTSYEYVEDNE